MADNRPAKTLCRGRHPGIDRRGYKLPASRTGPQASKVCPTGSKDAARFYSRPVKRSRMRGWRLGGSGGEVEIVRTLQASFRTSFCKPSLTGTTNSSLQALSLSTAARAPALRLRCHPAAIRASADFSPRGRWSNGARCSDSAAWLARFEQPALSTTLKSNSTSIWLTFRCPSARLMISLTLVAHSSWSYPYG